MAQTLFDRYVEIAEQMDLCESELERLKKERAALEEQMLRVFEETGTERFHTDRRTIFLRRDLYLKRREGFQPLGMLAELKGAGLERFLETKPNERELARYIDAENLTFRSFELCETYRVRTRRRTSAHE